MWKKKVKKRQGDVEAKYKGRGKRERAGLKRKMGDYLEVREIRVKGRGGAAADEGTRRNKVASEPLGTKIVPLESGLQGVQGGAEGRGCCGVTW